MKKNLITTLLIAGMLSAGMLFTACSNDDNDNEGVKTPDSPLALETEQVNAQLRGLDFEVLMPLEDAVDATTRGTLSDAAKELNSKLKELIDKLRGDYDVTIPIGCRFTYQGFNDALAIAWDISSQLEASKENSSHFLGLETHSAGTVSYTAKDGSLYTIAAEIDKEIGLHSWNIKVNGGSQFVISRNNEVVLTIETAEEKNRPVWLPIIIKDKSFTGLVSYKDFDIDLTYNRPDRHESNAVLTYSKKGSTSPILVMSTHVTNDANFWKQITHNVKYQGEFSVEALNKLISLNGTVDNINYMIVNSVNIIKCDKEGCDKATCDALVSEFNENVVMTLFMAGTNVGNVYMGAVYDKEKNRYFPKLMITSETLGLKDYVLTDLLKSLGISLESIFQSLTSI